VTIDIRSAGSILQFPRYVWERPRRGLFQTLRRMLGVGPRSRQQLAAVEGVPFPFAFSVLPGAEAEDALNELAGLRSECTPIIFGKPETAARTHEVRLEESYESLLTSLDNLDLDRWLGDRSSEFAQTEIPQPRGAWPAESQRENGLYSVRRILAPRDIEPEVVIGLVPTSEPALVPLRLGYGNWNDCPAPAVHTAFARRWNALYGANPVAFAGDIVEYRVAHPITDREQAITVALEQFYYCPDIVLQGTETIERLASSLLRARYWFFWWD
jgi:Domain of unknown function (DUF4253)